MCRTGNASTPSLYPDGVDASFNAGMCCGTAMTGVDDVAAALAMADDVADLVPLDDSRLYVTGFSNVAAMTYRIACETNRFAAFGPSQGIRSWLRGS
jgi:polyhydroxybutyrate depolymerase